MYDVSEQKQNMRTVLKLHHILLATEATVYTSKLKFCMGLPSHANYGLWWVGMDIFTTWQCLCFLIILLWN